MRQLRLDKYLADMGRGSRSQIRQDVRKGMVKVNGITVKTPELKIDPEDDQVSHAGEPVGYAPFAYYMLNKPAGCVSATEDRREKTVLDLIAGDGRKDLFPVGRLDKDTEGLLLITNDGALAHRLLHPKKHVDKTYYARLEGPVAAKTVREFEAGLDIGDERPTLPARLHIIRSGPVSEVEITIREGRFHQIKRMAEAVGSRVLYLKRLSMGPLALDPALGPGEFRPLSEEETAALGQLTSSCHLFDNTGQ
ncbi:MAG: rRNA pseudouridine synthase [Lachnospiraceae bacterium]|jgi:16S rRNA pseudouridine516 synthase|nr:rRNA pseudouridine synthase [Lachnospiraceae bacterium]